MRYIVLKSCKECPYRVETLNSLETFCFGSKSRELLTYYGKEVDMVDGFPEFCPLGKKAMKRDDAR